MCGDLLARTAGAIGPGKRQQAHCDKEQGALLPVEVGCFTNRLVVRGVYRVCAAVRGSLLGRSGCRSRRSARGVGGTQNDFDERAAIICLENYDNKEIITLQTRW